MTPLTDPAAAPPAGQGRPPDPARKTRRPGTPDAAADTRRPGTPDPSPPREPAGAPVPFRTRRFTPVPPAERPRRSRRATRVGGPDGVRVLLFADTDPGIPGSRWWVTPGGGIDPGESEVEAGVREVFEETGLRVAASDLLGPVVTRTVVHGYSDQVLSQHETFFVVRTPRFEPDTSGHTPDEQITLSGHRWIALEELDTLPEPVWPQGLAALVALADEPPLWPRTLGVVEESTLPVDAR